MRRTTRAFTIIELLIVMSIIAIMIGILVPALSKARAGTRVTKDQTNVKGIVQGLIVFAQSNKDAYPLPSELDKKGSTTGNPTSLENNNNTGNIYSVLIFNGFVAPRQFIGPSELNTLIRRDENYDISEPSLANDPANALWDPGFAGYPGESGSGTGQGRRNNAEFGNNSYAHLTPFGRRLASWTNNGKPSTAVIASRGPVFGGSPSKWRLAPGPTGTESLTLKIHGTPGQWEGNVGYNDSRVVFETTADPKSVPISFGNEVNGGFNHNDNLFVNENDQTGAPTTGEPHINTNMYLKIYGEVAATANNVNFGTIFQD